MIGPPNVKPSDVSSRSKLYSSPLDSSPMRESPLSYVKNSPENSFVPDLVITSITPPLKPEYSTDAGATFTESCSIAFKEIGLL